MLLLFFVEAGKCLDAVEGLRPAFVADRRQICPHFTLRHKAQVFIETADK